MIRKNRLAGPKGSKSITECMLWLWLAITRSQTSCSMHKQGLKPILQQHAFDTESSCRRIMSPQQGPIAKRGWPACTIRQCQDQRQSSQQQPLAGALQTSTRKVNGHISSCLMLMCEHAVRHGMAAVREKARCVVPHVAIIAEMVGDVQHFPELGQGMASASVTCLNIQNFAHTLGRRDETLPIVV